MPGSLPVNRIFIVRMGGAEHDLPIAVGGTPQSEFRIIGTLDDRSVMLSAKAFETLDEFQGLILLRVFALPQVDEKKGTVPVLANLLKVRPHQGVEGLARVQAGQRTVALQPGSNISFGGECDAGGFH